MSLANGLVTFEQLALVFSTRVLILCLNDGSVKLNQGQSNKRLQIMNCQYYKLGLICLQECLELKIMSKISLIVVTEKFFPYMYNFDLWIDSQNPISLAFIQYWLCP